MSDPIGQVQEVTKNVYQFKRQRYWIMVFIQFTVGLILVITPEKYFSRNSFLLDELGQGHRSYGLFYLIGGVVLLGAFWYGYRKDHHENYGSISLRFAHAILAGCFTLIAIVQYIGIFAGSPTGATYAPMITLLAWEHMRAGISADPVTRSK